jgi:uncharacterized protein YjbI with pentapeptide repeats
VFSTSIAPTRFARASHAFLRFALLSIVLLRSAQSAKIIGANLQHACLIETNFSEAFFITADLLAEFNLARRSLILQKFHSSTLPGVVRIVRRLP